jgi:signal-transduction protein with cAMP-binding, CBS, and nucleotidyltransferase domain
LLINYANEKLQNHFNKHIFEIEQAQYEAEHIDWSYITFNDNQQCVDLLDGKPNGKTGIFQTLDDLTTSGRQDVNSNFLVQLNQTWSTASNRHPYFITPRFNSDQLFGIKHFAGDVFYTVHGFTEKNRDSTSADMKDLLSRSTNGLLKSIMEEQMQQDAVMAAAAAMGGAQNASKKKQSGAAKAGSMKSSSFSTKLKEDSISKQFINSLKSLHETLEATTPYYVRCLKPNNFKQPDRINSKQVLQQLRYAGMMETIRIRREGYSIRQPHEAFFSRYSCLDSSCKTLITLVNELSSKLNVNKSSWQVGSTKIFIKQELYDRLESFLFLRYSSSAKIIKRFWKQVLRKKRSVIIQTKFRMYSLRKKYRTMLRGFIKFQSVVRRHFCLINFRAVRIRVVNAQRFARGRLARKLLKSLRNPFVRMTYDELTQQLAIFENDIHVNFQNGKFAECDVLEANIKDIVGIRRKIPLGMSEPASRLDLEQFLLQIEYQLEGEPGCGDQELLGKLRQRKGQLQSLRPKFPTVEEVSDKLATSKKELEDSMKNKQFKKCSELQTRVQEQEKLLADLTSAMVYGGAPPMQSLIDKQTALEGMIANALQDKKFDLCGSLQSDLDKVVDQLKEISLSTDEIETLSLELQAEFDKESVKHNYRAMGSLKYRMMKIPRPVVADAPEVPHMEAVEVKEEPQVVENPLLKKSYKEITDMITVVKTELEGALAQKAYSRCAELEAQLSSLEEVKAQIPKPLTRKEVEEKIKLVETEIESALSRKQYKQCDELNIQLTNFKLTLESMPTSAELKAKIIKTESDLKQHLAKKEYAKCEEMESTLSKLRSQLAEVAEQEKRDAPEVTEKDKENRVPDEPQSPSSPRVAIKPTAPAKPILTSVKAPPATVKKEARPQKTVTAQAGAGAKSERPVSKLRPRVPITVADKSSILEVAKAMASNRVDAALLVGPKGNLCGIVTDNDLTRRVVSVGVDTNSGVRDVMTKNPKCVCTSDPALDALDMMVDNHFRHLPVLDESGAVVGLLDIAKCLHDAISALEKVQGDGSSSSKKDSGGAAMADAMVTAMKKAGGSKGTNKAQLAAMKAMMESIFGGSIPTLASILDGKELVYVTGESTVREAAELMAKVRKGILVMDESGDSLVGIFTPKDLLNRVIAKELSADATLVSAVMTPNPDCVSPELTLVDALREMHDHKYLHLPVRDETTGRVAGLVDVMELLYTTAGGDGKKGWRDFFKGAMDARGDDSETASQNSHTTGSSKVQAKKAGTASVASNREAERPVSKLRPRVPITVADKSSILEVAKAMASNRVDAALLVGPKGNLCGIVTDNDLTRRVVSVGVDTNSGVRDVMTKNPKCVCTSDPALDALDMMVDNHFRHLPVLDESGAVVGLLDIAKCLHDAISALEKVQGDGSSSSKKDSGGAAMADAMVTAMKKAGGSKGTNKAQLAAMKAMMESIFGGSIPTLASILDGKELVYVTGESTVREAAELMAKVRKGILVMDESGDSLVGIFTPKDLLNRVIAKELSADATLVSAVMTPNPDCVSPELTLVDALREMHDHKYLHLPVRDETTGRVAGLVDVMELLYTTAGGDGKKGWRDFFKGAMDARGDDSETASQNSHTTGSKAQAKKLPVVVEPERPVSKLRPKPPLLVAESLSIYEISVLMSSRKSDAALLIDSGTNLKGILTDNDITRRVVAAFLDPSTSAAEGLMTKNPKCVCTSDPALDALDMMVENHFRHLPVLDESGSVVGLLDIAKCLHDAISALEKVQGDGSSSKKDNGGAAMADAMVTAMKKAGGSKGTNKAQLAAMKAMMEQVFGNTVPQVKTLLGNGPIQSVRSSTNVREAATIMAQTRKAVLVVDDGELVGLLTPKDVLFKIVAKGKSPDLTSVATVMSGDPTCVSPDTTLVEALREMHDRKCLHLPVLDEESGRVLGLVDVMELLGVTAGGDGPEAGTNRAKGWRDFFRGALDARGDDDESDTASQASSILGPEVFVKGAGKQRGSQLGGGSEATSEKPSVVNTGVRSGAISALQTSDFAFKIIDDAGLTHRIVCSYRTLDELKQTLAAKFYPGQVVADIVVKYVDDENDEVVISTDLSLREAVESAKGAGATALKLKVSSIKSSKPQIIDSTSSMATAPGTKSSNDAPVDNSNTLLLAGVAALGVVLAGAFILMRKK